MLPSTSMYGELMTIVTRGWTALILVVAASTACFAQTALSTQNPEPETRNSRLETRNSKPETQVSQQGLASLLRQAIENNLFLQAERLEVKAREARTLQAGLRANPTIMANVMKEITSRDNYLGGGFSQPLELFGRRGARKAAAQAEVDVARADIAEQEQMLASQVRAAYGEILALQRDLGFLRNLADTNRKTYDLVKSRIELGAAPLLEGNIQLVELRRLESQIATVEGKRDAALLLLKTLVALSPAQPLAVEGDLENQIELPPLEEAVREAYTRGDLRKSEAAQRAALAEVKRAQAEGRWDLTLSAEYRRSDNGFGQKGFNDAGELERVRGIFNMLMFGANFQIPLFNRNQGTVQEFEAHAEMESRRRKFLQLSIENELQAAYRRIEKLREGQSLYKEGALKLAADNLEVVRKKYELGAITLMDVLQEQRRYIEIQLGYTEILKELFNARAEVLRAIGRLT